MDLTELVWQGRTGFSPGDPAGCPFRDAAGKRTRVTIDSFPVVLNSVFGIPPGERLRQFTLCTQFHLTAADLKRPLGLHLPWVGEGWEVFLNGKSIRNELYLNESQDRLLARRIHRHQTVPVEPGLLRPGQNVLTARIAGYGAPTPLENNTNLGFLFSDGYVIDDYETLQREHSGHFRTMLTTVFLFFGAYHLLFYAYRRKDRYNLFFGLFATAMALDSFTGTGLAQEPFLDLSWINRVKYAAQAVAAGSILLFIKIYFFREKGAGTIGRLIVLTFGGLALAFGVVPFRYTEALLLVLHVTLIPGILYGGYLMGRALLRGKDDSMVLAGGASILLLCSVWDVVGNYVYPLPFLLAPIGTLFCILSLVFMLARRFLRLNSESERLNLELTRQKDSFRRFVPVQFLDLLEKNDIVDVSLGDSSRRQMSVLFADIRSFTGLSENMDTDDNFRFLNSFLQRMEPNIQEHAGFVDKFIGDAIMALFPEGGAIRSADQAVGTAVSLQREVAGFNQHRKAGGFEPIAVGIGINTGEVMLGTVGSRERLETTAIGNTVNLASRLESLTRYYDCGILISAFTAAALRDMDAYHWREVDAVTPYGKKQPVMIFEIYDSDPAELREIKTRTRDRILKGIIHYKSGKFEDALGVFEDLEAEYPGIDRLVEIYAERCREYIQRPPGEEWVGVAALSRK